MVKVLLPKRLWGAHANGWFMSADLSSLTWLTMGYFNFFESKKPASSNATTSIWVGSVPTCKGQNEGKASLSSAYVMLVPPTRQIKSSWQNWNLCSSIDTPFVAN
jgi:hypothetical protein